MHMHRKKYTHIHLVQHRTEHTICTHNLHTQNTEQNIRYNNMQHIEDNTEHKNNREQDIEQDNTETETNNHAENSAHNYRTYSLDYYNEYAYINNSNTIEIYTISKENI